jgi:hypothetical protein
LAPLWWEVRDALWVFFEPLTGVAIWLGMTDLLERRLSYQRVSLDREINLLSQKRASLALKWDARDAAEVEKMFARRHQQVSIATRLATLGYFSDRRRLGARAELSRLTERIAIVKQQRKELQRKAARMVAQRRVGRTEAVEAE